MEKLVKVSKFLTVLNKLPYFAEYKGKSVCSVICSNMTPKERIKPSEWMDIGICVVYTDGTKESLHEAHYDAVISKLEMKKESFRCSNMVWNYDNTLSHVEIIHWC